MLNHNNFCNSAYDKYLCSKLWDFDSWLIETGGHIVLNFLHTDSDILLKVTDYIFHNKLWHKEVLRERFQSEDKMSKNLNSNPDINEV